MTTPTNQTAEASAAPEPIKDVKPKGFLMFKYREFFATVDDWDPACAGSYMNAIIHYVFLTECNGIPDEESAMRKACLAKNASLPEHMWPEVFKCVFDNDRAFKRNAEGKWVLKKDQFWFTRYGKVIQGRDDK